MEKLTVGSLFAGIGGIDSGLEMTDGFTVKWQVENNEYSQKVLAKHWPDTPRYGDIRDCGAGRRHELAPVDLLCGGFPCQPHSLAGKRKASEDERDLWAEFYRLIRELRPRYVLGENVMGLLSSENGRFFGRILRDLAESGYDAEWQCLSAASVGAPHKRERVFIVAYSDGFGCNNGRDYRQGRHLYGDQQRNIAETYQNWQGLQSKSGEMGQDVAHADQQGLAIREVFGGHASAQLMAFKRDCSTGAGIWAIERGMGGKTDGVSRKLDEDRLTHAWLPGWEDNTPRVTAKQPHRVERLTGLGNAVVPQVAAFVGRCILEHANFVV